MSEEAEYQLEPVDLEQCQSIVTTTPGARGEAFRMGGPARRTKRCALKPVVVAVEVEPGEDGLIGAMSLCPECREACEVERPRGVSYFDVDGYLEAVDIMRAHRLVQ